MAARLSPRAQLRALLAVQVVSRIGNVVTTITVPFAVLARGGSATDVGIAAFMATVPIVLGGPFGGALVERVGFVRSSVASDVVSGLTLLAMPVLAWTVGLPFWALLALVFVSGLFDTPGESARRVLLPGLATAAGVPLERAVGHFEASSRLSVLIGAPLGGTLVAVLGPMPGLACVAITFGAAALLTALTVRGAVAPVEPGEPVESQGYWRDIADGFRFCVRDPLFRLVVALVLVTNLLDAARSTTLLPLYADQQLGGAQALGLVTGVFGGAAFLGSVAFGYVAHRVPRRLVFTLCFVLAGGPSLIVPALGLGLPWMLASAALSGLAAGSINPILGAVELERIPEHMRARVFGLLGAGAWAGIPVGGLVAGLAADGVGVEATFAVVAVVYTVVTLTPLLGGSWRLMERRSEPAPTVLSDCRSSRC
ncbi:MFS transporter [Curtobacterium flaccumfaciens]|uniref:MFS transporter n=1 Tax=Curtobacterium flaccumfaciens TaxID=2035 RepID=UPI001BDE91F9|nr:MFS transporter [Curtobacterium flaccumfaciens]MBT1607987.1 MFS transporter [Curtobacterium flaccumfaciens pv. betae]MBT1658218.1 MFS transporter [Curtobacterium flaccumfaciens pv. betae]MCS0471753.1 MFS transporter [Curtobacterium flaccumfaciens pv. betae]MCS0475119.1 MFS transporter [Curtobacterium flaccumfaciens pv. betae]MCS0478166.1 MFS transporter [Curtobacterium flaccumfaciens pv. betae]